METVEFDDLVRESLPVVYRYLLRLVRDSELAQDLTQETFIKAWKHIRRFQTDKPFRPWVMRIARNCAFDALRRKPVLPLDEAVANAVPDLAPSPQQHAQQAEAANYVTRLLGRLSETEREVLTLHYLDELSVSEIADVLQLPFETVRTRLRRARAAFRTVSEPAELPSPVEGGNDLLSFAYRRAGSR